MSLTQLCRCSHFPAPVVALRAPRDRLTISSWARGFHNLSNTEASTSHGLFQWRFCWLRGPHLIFQRKPTGQIENHLPSCPSSFNAEGVVISSRCPGTRSAPFRRSQDLWAGRRTALRRRQGQGPAPTEGKWGAWPLKSGRDIIFLINKGDMMGM